MTRTTQEARQSRERVVKRIQQKTVADLLPMMSERPMTRTTQEAIVSRLEHDAKRIARLRRHAAGE